jgi:hypothetical protein
LPMPHCASLEQLGTQRLLVVSHTWLFMQLAHAGRIRVQAGPTVDLPSAPAVAVTAGSPAESLDPPQSTKAKPHRPNDGTNKKSLKAA